MKKMASEFNEFDPIERAAADWTIRIDRGLTAEEQDEYTEWLGSDPRHREAMAHFQWGWDEFDRLAGLQTSSLARVDPDLLSSETAFHPKSVIPWIRIMKVATLPLAAILFLSLFLVSRAREHNEFPVEPAIELMARIEQRILEDGSMVELNRGTEIEVVYTPTERRITLARGEASFDVEKDSGRPFIVNVGNVDVRAVGTLFNVKYLGSQIDVVVSEGVVGVTRAASAIGAADSRKEAFLSVGQMGKVDLDKPDPEVEITQLTQTDLEELNKWRPQLLDYDSAPLKEIVTEFNRRNPIQIALADPALEDLRLSSSFWSDNVEGFVRLMVSSFGMNAEWRGSREIVLSENNSQAL